MHTNHKVPGGTEADRARPQEASSHEGPRVVAHQTRAVAPPWPPPPLAPLPPKPLPLLLAPTTTEPLSRLLGRRALGESWEPAPLRRA